MKKILSVICSSFLLFCCLSAQKYESITVKQSQGLVSISGKIFVFTVYYPGRFSLKNGLSNSAMLNYDLLLGRSFLKGLDTLVINRKNDLDMVTVEQDTFIYRNGYYKIIHGGRLKVCTKDKIKLE